MDIFFIKDEQIKEYEDELLELLTEGDEEFVPPLSARSSTTQADLSGTEKVSNGIVSYFEEMKKQKMLIATKDGKLIAFVSYRENFTNDIISDKDLPNIYLSTLIVRLDGRGQGLTQKMYDILFKEYENTNIFTRTWSTNGAHIKILSKFGFETIHVLKDHRGQGIDTVYFKKKK